MVEAHMLLFLICIFSAMHALRFSYESLLFRVVTIVLAGVIEPWLAWLHVLFGKRVGATRASCNNMWRCNLYLWKWKYLFCLSEEHTINSMQLKRLSFLVEYLRYGTNLTPISPENALLWEAAWRYSSGCLILMILHVVRWAGFLWELINLKGRVLNVPLLFCSADWAP